MKKCSENMQQIYKRKPMPKCDFYKVALQRHGFSSVNLLHIFRTPFHKSTSGQLLLKSEMLKIYHHFHSLPLFLRLKA